MLKILLLCILLVSCNHIEDSNREGSNTGFEVPGSLGLQFARLFGDIEGTQSTYRDDLKQLVTSAEDILLGDSKLEAIGPIVETFKRNSYQIIDSGLLEYCIVQSMALIVECQFPLKKIREFIQLLNQPQESVPVPLLAELRALNSPEFIDQLSEYMQFNCVVSRAINDEFMSALGEINQVYEQHE